jgi:hypothetical protein
MKKIFTLTTGIIFLAIGLYTGSCKSCHRPDPNLTGKEDVVDDSTKVAIHLSYIKINGKHHFFLHDSHENSSIDSLETAVKKGGKVMWKLDDYSGIRKIDTVFLMKDPKKIFRSEPTRDSDKQFSLIISMDQDTGLYKYVIIASTKKQNDTVKIDPFIRIPPPQH